MWIEVILKWKTQRQNFTLEKNRAKEKLFLSEKPSASCIALGICKNVKTY